MQTVEEKAAVIHMDIHVKMYTEISDKSVNI